MTMKSGDVLRGKYRIKRVLGEGGMGVVVRATHLRLDQDVAIKMLRDPHAPTHVVERFAREARAAARLKGDHAVRVLDVDDEGGAPFLVMEHLEGRDLDRLVRKDGPLAAARAAGVVLEACEGLAEAHAAGIVHRDVKPANLFLAKTARGGEIVKILDFGISKAIESRDPTITEGERVLGSPSFMAPEQLKSARDVDARADVWALGVTLHFLLAGELPFPGDSATEVAARIASEPPRALPASVPAGVAEVVAKCLAKDRDARYASVADVARALAPFVDDGEAAARRVSSVLRMPVAGAVSSGAIASPSSTAIRAAGPATASLEQPGKSPFATASLDEPAQRFAHAPLVTSSVDAPRPGSASVDAPGPVSLGSSDEPIPRASSAPPAPSRRTMAIGGAIVLAAIGGWLATRAPSSPAPRTTASAPPTATPTTTTSAPAPATAPATATATTTTRVAAATASYAAPIAASSRARSTADASAPHTATPEDPLKLDLK